MEHSLRYFFSAVFQGYAALVAIGAVFLVFKIQEINKIKEIRWNQLDKIFEKNIVPIIAYLFDENMWKEYRDESTRWSRRFKLLDEIDDSIDALLLEPLRLDLLTEKQKHMVMKHQDLYHEDWIGRLRNFRLIFKHYTNIEKTTQEVLKAVFKPLLALVLTMIISLGCLLIIDIVSKIIIFSLACAILIITIFNLFFLLRALKKIILLRGE